MIKYLLVCGSISRAMEDSVCMYISMSASDFPASEARYARGKPHTHLKALCCWPSNGMNAGYKFSKVRYDTWLVLRRIHPTRDSVIHRKWSCSPISDIPSVAFCSVIYMVYSEWVLDPVA